MNILRLVGTAGDHLAMGMQGRYWLVMAETLWGYSKTGKKVVVHRLQMVTAFG
jgi:hypothetical protein